MKNLLILICISCCCNGLTAQNFYSNFNSQTLENWTNTDGSTTNMEVLESGSGSTYVSYLHKECDGSATAVGEMAIRNTVDYSGDWTCYDPSGINCFAWIGVRVKNDNAFDLYLRLGIRSGSGAKAVSDYVMIVPAFSDWVLDEEFYAEPMYFTLLNGPGTIEELFTDIVEFRIIHNPSVAFEGAIVSGVLDLDQVYVTQLLGTADKINSSVTLYPNPMQQQLNIEPGNSGTNRLVIRNVLGDIVFSLNISDVAISRLEVSELASGLYFASLYSDNRLIEQQKLIKR